MDGGGGGKGTTSGSAGSGRGVGMRGVVDGMVACIFESCEGECYVISLNLPNSPLCPVE